MAWLNAQGNQIGTQPITIQIDVPCEAVGDHGKTLVSVNRGAVLAAIIQLVFAMMSGNPTAITAAIQALINAFMGA